ncbi:tetratricopeptide repeat protein, partial [Escherichia coli]
RADDQEMNESIFQQRELLRERIDDRLSEEIVQNLRTLNGEEIWPWMLPFSGEVLPADICFQNSLKYQ